MLKNNIYLFYPPGYCGTYVKWAIMKSEKDCALSTIDDPIHYVSDTNLSPYGGPGTAHLHLKSPTHMSMEYMTIWMMYNKPTDKRIYPINSTSHGEKLGRTAPADIIKRLIHSDPNGVFINIHHGGNNDIRDFCILNLLTKWPVFYKVINSYLNFSVPDQLLNPENYESRSLRNFYVKNLLQYFPSNFPMNKSVIKKFIDDRKHWYETRKKYNPQEICEEEYVFYDEVPANIKELNVLDIVSDQFPEKLKECLDTYGLEHFDFDYLKNFHNTYLSAQKNLSYINDIRKFRSHGIISDFLLSHPFTQAILLLEQQRKRSLPDDWEKLSTQYIITS